MPTERTNGRPKTADTRAGEQAGEPQAYFGRLVLVVVSELTASSGHSFWRASGQLVRARPGELTEIINSIW